MKIQLELRYADSNWYFNTPCAPDADEETIDRLCTGGFWLSSPDFPGELKSFLQDREASIIPVTLTLGE